MTLSKSELEKRLAAAEAALAAAKGGETAPQGGGTPYRDCKGGQAAFLMPPRGKPLMAHWDTWARTGIPDVLAQARDAFVTLPDHLTAFLAAYEDYAETVAETVAGMPEDASRDDVREAYRKAWLRHPRIVAAIARAEGRASAPQRDTRGWVPPVLRGRPATR